VVGRKAIDPIVGGEVFNHLKGLPSNRPGRAKNY